MSFFKNFLQFLILIFVLLSLEGISLDATMWDLNNYSSNSNAGCIESEREALLKFKADLKDPSGLLGSWVGSNCCSWYGVSCNRETGNVVMLDLKNRHPLFVPYAGEGNVTDQLHCLSGKLNPSLIELKYLNYLDLSLNNFQGLPIPKFIGSLSQLIYLNLSRSSFSGLVPAHLGNLSNLHYLDLFGLSLSSSDMNWVARLSHLKYLNLEGVNLRVASPTWLQDVNMLPSLSQLYLANTNLNHLPHSLSKVNFSTLVVLDLEGNEFNTTMPQWVFNISTLMHLNLKNCSIQGSMPGGAGRSFCNLRDLYLGNNYISGDITDFLGSMSECRNNSLERLSLNGNRISGQIPESVGNFKYMKYLYLEGNAFSGSIPFSIGNLSFLETLDLNDNKMNGTIPENIGQLSELVYLGLSSNSWKGVMSEVHFSGLAKLKQFFIQCQSLAINLRHEWIPPFNLETFIVYDCNCGPSFPSWLKTQRNISALALSNVFISEKIPDWIWKLSPQLRTLDLSFNQFHGEVPSSLQFLPQACVVLSSNFLEGSLPVWHNMKYLYLDNNSFSGPIPSNFLEEIPFLDDLRIFDNKLTGSVPSLVGSSNKFLSLDMSNNNLSGSLNNFPWQNLSLHVINLSNNRLSGEIPESICSSTGLHVLALHGNNLSGNPFLSLRNCTTLKTLDLGENGFYGSIPDWVGEELSNLLELGLRRNNFSGNILEELCGLPSLHILDLAHNGFSGFIPPCIGNLSGLKFLPVYKPFVPRANIYDDKMELVVKGREVEYVHILGIVNTIDLSSNNFVGEIPEQITSLTYLGTLNLSRNQLTGKIPGRIYELQRLETLDLSFNHLSGPIPSSMSSMTLLNSLNLS